MKITYDKGANAVYIYIKYPIKDGEAIKQKHADKNIIIDFDKRGKLLGVEVLNASKVMNKKVIAEAEHN